jgi:hypothetical protein|uniref:Uncharacterized protein n=1 Tax=Picea glauca TaxID=3330 RepID=A0A124GN34_PICGL|nr:hypothetical protein ABT39_MTgene5772 [Picea glauca]QHR90453.1 hypothetical protein Q903MT_gene4477 [Picea sitchensis]
MTSFVRGFSESWSKAANSGTFTNANPSFLYSLYPPDVSMSIPSFVPSPVLLASCFCSQLKSIDQSIDPTDGDSIQHIRPLQLIL